MKNRFITYLLLFLLLTSGKALFAQGAQMIEAKFTTKRTSVYRNETIEITLDIRSTGVSIGRNLQLGNMPPDNQLVQIGAFNDHGATKKETNGILVETRKFTGKFRPLVTGTIIIKPRINLTILTKKRSFFGTVTHQSPRTLQMNPLNLSVRSVPESMRPPDYENAVGKFSFDVKVSPSDIMVGDLINISTVIRGDGYLDDISPIGIVSTHLFKAYDSKAIKQDTVMRSFVQTVVVLSTNATAIPKLSFSYFDPETASYKRATRGPFPLSFHAEKNIKIKQFTPEADPNKPHPDNETAGIAKVRITSQLRQNITTGTVIEEEPIRFAPSYSALITAEPPLDAQVRILNSYQEWRKIEYKRNRGWIPHSALSEKTE
jgi:hypothetical protein